MYVCVSKAGKKVSIFGQAIRVWGCAQACISKRARIFVGVCVLPCYTFTLVDATACICVNTTELIVTTLSICEKPRD